MGLTGPARRAPSGGGDVFAEPAFRSDKVVDYTVNVREEKDEKHYFNLCRLFWNPCVEKLNVSINCEDARPGEVEEAEAAARYAVDVHPNHPTLEMTRYAEDKMMLSDHHQQPLQPYKRIRR